MLLLQFLHLQQDYEYNLELLDGRDAELERYDKEHDAIGQELAAKDSLMTQLHACLAKAESGLPLSYVQDTEVAPHLEPNCCMIGAMKCRHQLIIFLHMVDMQSPIGHFKFVEVPLWLVSVQIPKWKRSGVTKHWQMPTKNCVSWAVSWLKPNRLMSRLCWDSKSMQARQSAN